MLRRLLNITSIACLVLCVALMGLWVRSYYWSDTLYGHVSESQSLAVTSQSGRIRWFSNSLLNRVWPWTIRNRQMDSVKETEFRQFVVYTRGSESYLAVPYWFLSLMTGLLAMACRPKWPPRFTLRELFIATTFVAIVLGMIAWLDRAWIGK